MSSQRPFAASLTLLVALMLTLALGLPGLAQAQPGQNISLPAPQTQGGLPLMQALKQRHTSREFDPRQLEPQVLSDLLWAAFGINRPESGRRTAPSAKNWQEVDIYVVLAEGVYRYDPKGHALVWVASGDLRPLAGRQGFVNHAPLNLVFVADLARVGHEAGDDKALLTGADVGFISQNVYLFCASQGLNTVVRAGMDKPGLVKALGLRPEQQPILAQTVGHAPGK
ncbi:MAG: SagB/ThcOx family dehydrogenase [Pseudomonadota bacterium]